MKFILRLFLILIGSYYLGFYTSWWATYVVVFIVCFFFHGNFFALLNIGFLSGFILWFLMSYKIDMDTNSIMSNKIIELFPLDEKLYLFILSGLIGGFLGAMGAVTGSYFKKLFIKKKKHKSVYHF